MRFFIFLLLLTVALTETASPAGPAASRQCDVLVVGAGAAGLTAAALLRERSLLRVLVVEKEPLIGGSSSVSGGQWAVSGTVRQKELGIADSDRIFFDDMMRVGRGVNDKDLVKAFIAASRRQYEWVVAHGVEPKTVSTSSGMSIPRAHIFNPTEVVSLLYRQCRSLGVELLMSTRVEHIEKQKTAARGFTVHAVSHGRPLDIQARWLVLATGGFSRSKALMHRFAPGLEGALAFSAPGSEGDGLRFGMALGAGLRDMDNIRASYGFSLRPVGSAGMSGIFYSGAIIVNQEGERFVNESLGVKELGDYALRQARTFIVFDDAIRHRQMLLRPNDRRLWEPIDHGTIPDYVKAGETVAEVAAQARIPPQALQRTVDAYNRAARSEVRDPFGRTSLSSGWGKMVPIEKPPFFVMPAFAGVIGTYGGLRINTACQVLTEQGTAIEGLLAAGEVVGGVHGRGFMAGTSFAKANALGRIAAETILRATLGEDL